MGTFRMPSLGADMEEGTVVEWFVAVGDTVHRGDIIAAVDTDKATIEVEVFEDGVMEELLAESGDVLAVGAPLAHIDSGGASPESKPDPEPIPVAVRPSVPEPRRVPEPRPDREPIHGGAGHRHASHVLSPLVRHLADRLVVDTSTLHGSGQGGRVTRDDVERAARTGRPDTSAPESRTSAERSLRASPRARRRAAELGVELGAVRGTGPGGTIREQDVLASTGPAAPAASSHTAPSSHPRSASEPAEPADRQASMRRAIARTMSRSNREIPHYYLSTTVDLHSAMRWVEQHNAECAPSERLLPAALVLRATAIAAAEVGELNGHWIEDRFQPAGTVDLGVAVSLRQGGLIAPVIREVDSKSVEEVMAELRHLVTRARRGALRSSELDSATMTVTNLGDRGVEVVNGVIHPPQVALVGVGRIADRALVVDGVVAARPSVVVSLAADHRASDGQSGSRLLTGIDAALQRPEDL